MEALIIVGLIAALSATALAIHRFVFAGMNLAGATGELFTGLRAPGWPAGVQEEDRDRPWGRGPDGRLEPGVDRELRDDEARPQLVRVKPVVRGR